MLFASGPHHPQWNGPVSVWCPVLFTLCHQEGVCRGLQGHPGRQPRGYLLTLPLHAVGRPRRGELQGPVPLHLPVWPGRWRGPTLTAARNCHRPVAPGFHPGHACDPGALAGLPGGEPLEYSGHLKGHVEHVPQLHPGYWVWPEQLQRGRGLAQPLRYFRGVGVGAQEKRGGTGTDGKRGRGKVYRHRVFSHDRQTWNRGKPRLTDVGGPLIRKQELFVRERRMWPTHELYICESLDEY